MSTLAGTSLRTRVDELEPLVRKHAAEAERDRHLSPVVAEAMIDAGLFRMFVPRELGGGEVDVLDGFRAIERLSTIDSAAGWNLQIVACGVNIGALLPEDGAREVFSDPRAIVAGGFNPPGSAVAEDGGFWVNGRWPFVSACQNATWFVTTALQMADGAPVFMEDGHPVLLALVYPVHEASIVETWDPLGMRGTGSHDVVANNVFVPSTRATALRPFDDVGPAFQGPLYKLGVVPTILGNAVVALGVARAAIDEAVEKAKTRIPAFNQPRPIDRGVVHAHLARAEAGLSAARAYFYGALGDGWQSAQAGHRPAPQQRLHLQLAASQAATAVVEAVNHVQLSVGSSGVREEQLQFARHFRDVNTIVQHALCSPARFESMGQVMLGLESDWTLINL